MGGSTGTYPAPARFIIAVEIARLEAMRHNH
jgi:hypothetical protein